MKLGLEFRNWFPVLCLGQSFQYASAEFTDEEIDRIKKGEEDFRALMVFIEQKFRKDEEGDVHDERLDFNILL